MAAYIESNLYEGEQLLYSGQFHWLHWARAWAALLVLGIVIFGIVFFIAEMIRLNTTEFAVTDRRVVMKKGLWSADLQEISLDAIEGSTLNQSVLGRMFGFGRLTVHGRGEMHIDFPTMAKPKDFRLHAERSRQAIQSRSRRGPPDNGSA